MSFDNSIHNVFDRNPLALLVVDATDCVVDVLDTTKGFDLGGLIGKQLSAVLNFDERQPRGFESFRLPELGLRLVPVRASEPEDRSQATQAADEAMFSSQFLAYAESLSDLGCFIWDISSNRVQWSQGLYRIYGLDSSKFAATLEAFVERVLPEDRAAVHAAVQAAIQSCGTFQSVERIRHSSGEVRVLESCGRVLTDGNGKASRLIGVCRDVTRRMEFEKSQAWQIEGLKLLAQFAESTMTQRDLIDWLPLVEKLSQHLSCQAFAIYTNIDRALHLEIATGFNPPTIQAIQKLQHGELLCGVCAQSRDLLYVNSSERELHPEGNALWSQGFLCYVAIPLLLGDQLLGVMSLASKSHDSLGPVELDFVRTVGRMVAASKAQAFLEDEKQLAEERNGVILNQARMITWEANPQTLDFTFLSGPCQQLSGYSREKWIEAGFWREHLLDCDARSAFEQLRESSELFHQLECRMIHAEGHEIWLQIVVEVVQTGSEISTLRGVLWEITRSRQLEAQLRNSQKMEAIGRLAGGVAHDFNNMLTVIHNYAELLSMVGASDQVSDLANGILDAARRAGRLTRQLLMFGNKGVQTTQVINLNEIIQQSKLLLDHLVTSTQIHLRLAADLPSIEADPTHLDQVLVNLCVNARDAMPEGGEITIETRNTVVEEQQIDFDIPPGAYVELAIIDRGVGMPEEVRTRALEPFYSTKPFGEGTGIGLAVVYGVVKECGGAIRIESTPNAGTRVRILFPKSTLAPVPVQGEKIDCSGGSEVILLVEDEEGVRQSTSAALRLHGFHVLEASSASEALSLASSIPGQISLLITDLIMPETIGPELVEQMLARYPQTSVLYISGFSERMLLERVRSSERDFGFLQKPFTVTQLVKTVREIFDTRATND